MENKTNNATNDKKQWKPTQKQLEELKKLLDYNIGVYNYNGFQIVYKLYKELESYYYADYGEQDKYSASSNDKRGPSEPEK